MKNHLVHAAVLAATVLISLTAHAANQNEIDGPAGSGKFGTLVKLLPNGNFVITDPFFDDGATADVGAVYLCHSASGSIISTLKGSVAGDMVGNGGIVVLSNGNFVVISSSWDSGATANVGAVTLVDGTAGLNGTVSSSNSLVGSSTNDTVGSFFGFASVTALPNGNYIVSSVGWDNGGNANAGAATWCSGTTPTVGVVSAANSLIGSHAEDQIGSVIQVLPVNGNAVLRQLLWDNGATVDAGAISWMSKSAPTVGIVSAANSLVGTTFNDRIGEDAVTVLTNGNYVVTSHGWNNGGTVDVGAVTWCNGSTGRIGAVSAVNSLTGSVTNDQVGSQFSIALSNGNYVVISKLWNNGGANAAGAITWCDGSTGRTGAVSAANSLVGTHSNDNLGSFGVTPLTNGNYVVCSDVWDNDSAIDAGAITWGSGTAGITGAVSTSNSLFGVVSQSRVGRGGAIALSNGNCVAQSLLWDSDTALDVGAVTWINGSTGRVGAVSATNSLVGTEATDMVGSSGILPLTNGNYVVLSIDWHNGALAGAGAATWCNGNTGMSGFITSANSLVGSAAADHVGSAGGALTNGHYVISSPDWNNGSTPDAGAVTWGHGGTGVTGFVSAANSLVGSANSDAVGNLGVVPLDNGNYIVRSSDWDNSGVTDAGAVTFGSGATGVKGPITAANSFVGATINDHISYGVSFFPGGYYAVRATLLDNGAAADAGAVTFVSNTAIVGTFVSGAGIQGIAANGGTAMSVDYYPISQQTLIGRPFDNKVRYVAELGKVSFDAPLYTVGETTGPAVITLTRSGGLQGGLAVQISTSSVGTTAKAFLDYLPQTTQTVLFAPGATTATFNIPITPDSVVNEPNETFKVILTSGVAGVLGARTTALVRIVDTGDVAAPTITITTPAAGAHLPVNPGDPITITGTQKDNRGPGSVSVAINGGAYKPASMVINGTSATWSVQITPGTGLNTIQVLHTDSAANLGALTTHSFFVTRPLVVKTLGGTGSLTTGYSPSSFRDVGKLCTVTATPALGMLFENWTLSGGATMEEIGVTPATMQLPTLSFIFKEGMQLTANIVPSPFLAGSIAGIYNGSIHANPTQPDFFPLGPGPEDGTLPGIATEGAITINVQTNGYFTGSLSLDGTSLPIAGNFDTSGDARFGATRGYVLSVPRPGKTTLLMGLSIDITGPTFGQIGGQILDLNLAVSTIVADRAHWNGTSLMPTNLLRPGNANGIFNVEFQVSNPALQPVNLTLNDYPQGFSIGVITVMKSGAVSIVGTLSEGTPFTASGTLDQNRIWHLFTPLYNKRGFLIGDLIFDTAQLTVDVYGNSLRWSRPLLDDQYYPGGWPTGLVIDALGTKFTPPPTGTSVMPALTQSPTDINGNADLIFAGPPLLANLTHTIGITPADVVTNLPANTNFKLTLIRSSGKFSGTFTLNGTIPAFQGILLSKGTTQLGIGFFKTLPPKVKDYTGKAGGVFLTPQ